MIKDKKKIGTALDEIDEEILERNEAEDVINKLDNHANINEKNDVTEDGESEFSSTED